MRVLVTWGSKHGGTAGIGEIIVHALEEAGHDVVGVAARDAPSPHGFDAVVIGGAVYANRWQASARHWIEHHVRDLRTIPTWVFSSGPLDTSADDGDLAPPRDVRSLMRRIGAVEHRTFGGKHERMGDWRNPQRIRAWATEIASELPAIQPRPAEDLHGHTLMRLIEYGAYGWAILALTLGILLPLTRPSFAVVIHAIAAPVVFALLALRYHSVDGARTPFVAAVTWTAMVAVLHAVLVSTVVRPEIALVASISAYWLPVALVFVASFTFGMAAAMLPVTRSDESRAVRA